MRNCSRPCSALSREAWTLSASSDLAACSPPTLQVILSFLRAFGQRRQSARRADAVGSGIRGGARVDETAGQYLGENRVRLAATPPSAAVPVARRLFYAVRFRRPAHRPGRNEGDPCGHAQRLGDGRGKRTCTDLAERGAVNGGPDNQHQAVDGGWPRRVNRAQGS